MDSIKVGGQLRRGVTVVEGSKVGEERVEEAVDGSVVMAEEKKERARKARRMRRSVAKAVGMVGL